MFSGTMATASVHSLCFAYPCSVNAGVDPVKYTEELIRRKEELGDKDAAPFREELNRLFPGCSDNREKLIEKATKLRDSWGYAVHEDKTMMKDDMNDVAERSNIMGFNESAINKFLKVIEEFTDEHINDVRAFLTCIPIPNAIRFLYLCGHGLSDKLAGKLRRNPADDKTRKSPVWPWELCSCEKTMNQAPSVITGNALKGDIMVFSSGLLTPEWVVEKLREYEENRVQNTIIIVIDACYSGTWVTRIRECLTGQPLQYTRVIVQASCGEDEVSYGGYFTPVFCALQDTKKRAELQRLYEEDKDAMEGIELLCEQTPTFYDSERGQKFPNSFYFIDDVEFFNFCIKYFTNENWDTERSPRSIPTDEYPEFFASFSSDDDAPEILCFRLKHMRRNDSPLAFFLIEWKEKLYHIHLHFNNFKDMKLTGVNHVDVINGKGKYKYSEDSKDPKIKIDAETDKKNGTKYWSDHVELNETAIVDHFKKFAQPHLQKLGEHWDNESSWNTKKNLIRSRSACLEKCIAMEKFKPVANN